MLLSKKTIGTVAYLGGVPAVYEKFCWSWSQMIQYNTEYVCPAGTIIHYDRAQMSYHVYARNSLVDKMQGDWILMFDTDHSFEPDIVSRMLFQMNKHNIDVLVGLYMYTYDVFEKIASLSPSDRNELEVTDLNMMYQREGSLSYSIVEGDWMDMGTPDSLLDCAIRIRERSQK